MPDAFLALDGLFETFLTVLDNFGAYKAVIDAELERYINPIPGQYYWVHKRFKRRPEGVASPY